MSPASKKKGILHLVPTMLAPDSEACIPPESVEIFRQCRIFIVESVKSGRRHIKKLVPDKAISECVFLELNEHTEPLDYSRYLDAAGNGESICLISDAGSPCIADPGTAVVKLAHRQGIRVQPHSGPSSIFMALMASGFDGQRFRFHGYLSRNQSERRNQIKQMEREVHDRRVTQIFMETPYRNMALFGDLLKTLNGKTRLAIACDITSAQELIVNYDIDTWKSEEEPLIHKRPCIFILG